MSQSAPLPKPVKVLSWVSFFADVSSEMIYPVIPLFIVGVLQAPAAVLGATEGLAELIVSFIKGLSGFVSDKKGERLPYIRWGYGLAAFAKPLIGTAGAWPMVMLARSLDRFGKGLRGTARDALIADSITPDQAGRAFGFHRFMDTAGAVVGVLIGYGLLLRFADDLRKVFLLAAIPGIFSVLVTLSLKEKPRPTPAKSEWIPLRKLSPQYYRVLAAMAVFALANSSDTFLLLRAKDMGLRMPQVVLAYALFNVYYAALSYPLGSLSDRIGRKPILVAGWFVYAGTYLGFAYLDVRAVWFLMPIYGFFMAATDGIGKAMITSVIPKNQKGTAMGFLSAVVGIAGLLASVVAGVLWDQVNHTVPFAVGGVVALVAAIAAIWLLPRQRVSV